MRLYTPQEVGNLAGVSANAVRIAIHRGALEATRTPAGTTVRLGITRDAAERFAAQLQTSRKERNP